MHYLELLLPILALLSANAFATTVRTTVSGLEGKKCQVFLHLPETVVNRLPLAWFQDGTGVYTTSRNSDLNSFADFLRSSAKAAVLTINKPGIDADDSAPSGFQVNDAVYTQHTQDDLIACAFQALEWAKDQPQVDLGKRGMSWHGHSEGAQVVIRTFDRALRDHLSWSTAITLIQLDGLPLLGWKEIVNAQLTADERTRFWAAFDAKDSAVLRSFGGLAFAYWQIFSAIHHFDAR